MGMSTYSIRLDETDTESRRRSDVGVRMRSYYEGGVEKRVFSLSSASVEMIRVNFDTGLLEIKRRRAITPSILVLNRFFRILDMPLYVQQHREDGRLIVKNISRRTIMEFPDEGFLRIGLSSRQYILFLKAALDKRSQLAFAFNFNGYL